MRVRAREDRDIISAIPYLLGYHPTESVVVVGVTDGRLGPAARLDVAALAGDPELSGSHLGGMLASAYVPECLIIVFDDDPDLWWLSPLADAFAARDVAVVGGWQVGAEHFWPLADPWDRRPVAELAGSSTAAELVLAGFNPRPDRAALVADLAPYPDAVSARLARQRAGLLPLTNRTRIAAIEAWAGLLGDPAVPRPAAGRSVAPPRPLSDRVTATLLAAVADRSIRDAMLLATVVPGPALQACHDALRADHAGDPIWLTATGDLPEQTRCEAAVEVLTHLARASTGRSAADPLAMLAAVHWWVGDGTLANVAVELALHADDSHVLSRLVGRILDVGLPPPWRVAPSAWPEGA